MANLYIPENEHVETDDLRVIYKHVSPEHEHETLNMALCSHWPTRLHWELVKDGQNVSVGLHGIAAALMFLRRMYAFSGRRGFLSDGKDLLSAKPTLLNKLSWREVPLSDATEPEVLQDLFKELEISAEGKGPTLLEILNNNSMENIWGTPSMNLYGSKAMRKKEGKAPKIIQLSPRLPEVWKVDMIPMNNNVVLEDRVRMMFTKKRRTGRGALLQLLCNFPPFIRIHYQASEAGSEASHSFSNLRSFRLRAPVLANETDIVEEEHIYVLIACFINPNEKNKAGELRLYTDCGMPILPGVHQPPEWQHLHNPESRARLGDPGLDFIMLYGKTDNDKEGIECSELPPLYRYLNLEVRKEAMEAMERLMARLPAGVPSRVLRTQPEQTSATPLVHEAVSRQSTVRLASEQRSTAGLVSAKPDLKFSSSGQNERETGQLPRGPEPTQRDNQKRPYSGNHYNPSSGHRSLRHRQNYSDQDFSNGRRARSPPNSQEDWSIKQEPSTELFNAGRSPAQRQRGPYSQLGSQEAEFHAFLQSRSKKH
ncbi:hypothetical protein CHU98_g51 [Xylaria longipes]|nr:hypothetical protein CHU98_g51 [Xylaria longipes]